MNIIEIKSFKFEDLIIINNWNLFNMIYSFSFDMKQYLKQYQKL